MNWQDKTCETCLFRSKTVMCRFNPPQVSDSKSFYPLIVIKQKPIPPETEIIEKWYPACSKHQER